MSPLLPDELRIQLGPDQVILVRIRRELTRHGLKHRVLAKTAAECAVDPDNEAPWSAALKRLEEKLTEFGGRRTTATVILSNHFMRYAMVPWSKTLKNEAEEIAFARHCFRQTYGDSAAAWEFRLSSEWAGTRQLASAVDGRLLAELRALFEKAGVALRSVQPYLMAVYNHCCAGLQKRNAWLALLEPGCLCLAQVQQGYLASVRTMRVDDNWHESLSPILEREACLDASGSSSDEVFLWAPELANTVQPAGGLWKMRKLQPVVRKDFIPAFEGRFALPLSW